MNHTFHACKNGQQRPGSREDCPRCSPQASRSNQIIVRQQARISELTVALNNSATALHHEKGHRGWFMNCEMDECETARRLLDGAK